MSNYHILLGNEVGNKFSVVMHVPIPNTDNEVGVNYRTAAVQYQTDPETDQMPTSQVPFITSAEQIQLDSGELVEVREDFHTHPGETLAQKQARLDAMYLEIKDAVQAEWSKRLSYWGHDRDVP